MGIRRDTEVPGRALAVVIRASKGSGNAIMGDPLGCTVPWVISNSVATRTSKQMAMPWSIFLILYQSARE